MELNKNLAIGQTPLDEEEVEGLLIQGIATRYALEQFEQMNIEKAVEWTLRMRVKTEDLLTERFIKKLHSEMFGLTWN